MEIQNIYLIRHGQTDANKNNIYQGASLDPPLNKTGKRQAADLARYFGKHYRDVSKIIMSPSVRAVETAAAIVQELWYVNGKELPTEVQPDLHEIDHGVWEGKTLQEIQRTYPKLLEQWWYGDPLTVEFPGGEKIVDAIARVDRVFAAILDTNPKEHIVVVAHGGTNSIILNSILRGTNMRAFIQRNTAVNIIERWNGKNLRIPLIGSIEHLR